MSRKMKCLYYLVFCLVAAFVLFYPRYLYHHPLDVFYASEKGMQLGPSEVIKDMVPLGEDQIGVIGLWNGTLSVVETEQKTPFFWGIAPGITGYHAAKHTVNCYVMGGRYVYGLVKDADITAMRVDVESWEWPENIEDDADGDPSTAPAHALGKAPKRLSLAVEEIDADGYFLVEIPTEYQLLSSLSYINVCYTEGYDADGALVWQSGTDEAGVYHSMNQSSSTPDVAQQAVNAYLASLAE